MMAVEIEYDHQKHCMFTTYSFIILKTTSFNVNEALLKILSSETQIQWSKVIRVVYIFMMFLAEMMRIIRKMIFVIITNIHIGAFFV